MNIIIVGISHKTAPVEVREKISFPHEKIEEALYHLKSDPIIEEVLIVSTCNRVEIYAVVKETEAGFRKVKEFLTGYQPDLSVDALMPHLYFYAATDAVSHIFRVASSLDSMVVGESQILGQLKDYFEIALTHKSSGIILNKVMKKAISVAKRVRTETKVAENPVSVSSVAVELAKKIFSDLSKKKVLLLGAGEMAELAARHLISDGVDEISISTRNYQRALDLAKEFNGKPVKFEDFHREMIESDILICSTGAPHYLINYSDMQKAINLRKNRPIILIDISVPRNIDPKINDLDNIFLYDIDDLQLVANNNIKERNKETEKAQEIISEEIIVISKWFKSLLVVPTIIDLKEKTESIRKNELEKIFSKIDNLTPEQKRSFEELSNSIVNKILHAPLVVLKQEANSSNGNMYIEAARRLFNLDHDLPHHLHRTKEKKEQKPEEINK